MSIKVSAPGSSRTLLSMLQPRGPIFKIRRLNLNFFVFKVKNTLLGQYHGLRNTISRYITRPTTGTATTTPTQSQPGNDQQDMNADHGPESTPGPTPYTNYNNFPVSEAGDLEEAGPADRGNIEHMSNDRSLLHPKRSWMWVAALVVSALSLVVVPGLVLGVMTRQLLGGIALSSAIATIIGIFAGLYYYLNK